MNAEIISVGTELLMGQIVDTDAAHLASVLPEFGVSCRYRQTVGDNLERLTAALQLALQRADLVFTIGGLGPTEDDLTRDGIAAALDEELIVDEAIHERLRKLFAYRKIPWTESQVRQAQRPVCSRPLDNPNGTAPGLICEKHGKVIIALPGPKNEFVPMVEGSVKDYLGQLKTGQVIVSRIVKTAGIGESIVENSIRDLIRSENPTIAPYAHPGEVHLRITAQAANREQAEALILPIEVEIKSRLKDSVYGGFEDTLESTIIQILCSRGQKLVVAESCTAGGLGEQITRVPGCSTSFLGGIISYANEVKTEFLGVSGATLKTVGAVSEECANEMAKGARSRMKADWAVSITGIAGPDGGSEKKPVGLAYIGVAGPDGVTVEEHRFRGDRQNVRARSVQFALIQLWRRLKAT